MSAKNSTRQRHTSTQRDEPRFGRTRIAIRSAAAIARTAREIWPHQTAAELAVAAGMKTVRGAELLLAGKTALSGDSFLTLLMSDNGRRFLCAVMAAADPVPVWWRNLQRQFDLADSRTRLRELQRQIARLEEGAHADD